VRAAKPGTLGLGVSQQSLGHSTYAWRAIERTPLVNSADDGVLLADQLAVHRMPSIREVCHAGGTGFAALTRGSL
jgi:hypothetical protein